MILRLKNAKLTTKLDAKHSRANVDALAHRFVGELARPQAAIPPHADYNGRGRPGDCLPRLHPPDR